MEDFVGVCKVRYMVGKRRARAIVWYAKCEVRVRKSVKMWGKRNFLVKEFLRVQVKCGVGDTVGKLGRRAFKRYATA
jgi:hypothetical protein